MTIFRPCIDLHDGRVKQIVGSSLRDDRAGLKTNFVSDRDAAWYAELYQRDGLTGGHVILLGKGNDEAAKSAAAAFPSDWEIGQMACSHHFSADDNHFMISARGERALLCVDTLPVAGQDGAFFTLAILFDGAFRLTERGTGMLEAFRGSIHLMLSQQFSNTVWMDHMSGANVEVTCTCCRRVKTQAVNGWLHWDDYRSLATGKATSHAICERCAADIYGEEIIMDTSCVFPSRHGR